MGHRKTMANCECHNQRLGHFSIAGRHRWPQKWHLLKSGLATSTNAACHGLVAQVAQVAQDAMAKRRMVQVFPGCKPVM